VETLYNLLNNNIEIYKTRTLHVVLYGCEICSLTLSEGCRLRAWRISYPEGYLHLSKGRLEKFPQSKASRCVQLMQQYLGNQLEENEICRHIAHMGEKRIVHWGFVGKPTRKGPLRRTNTE
jgi:hypothetical protein